MTIQAAKFFHSIQLAMLQCIVCIACILNLNSIVACEVCGGDPAKKSEHEAAMALVPVADATNTALRSGAWSDPGTWSSGVPGTGAKVVIPNFIEVTYDVDSLVAVNWIRVEGVLRYATNRTTSLNIQTIIVTPQGRYEQGNSLDPILEPFTSTVTFTDPGPIDRIYDPRELSRGLVSNGTSSIHGAEKTHFTSCAVFPRAGDMSIELAISPVGWKIGDRIIVQGTHLQILSARAPDANGQGFPQSGSQTEERVISAINGQRISFATPLAFNHVAPLNNLKVYVGNLSRNIVYRSANTDYTSNAAIHRHGHVMFMHVGTVSVAWARFQDLGRTNKAIYIDDITRENTESGGLTPGTGTNVKGRYPLHFHRCGVEQQGAPPVMNVGTVVESSAGWGMVNHTSYVIMDSCISYKSSGAAFVEEGGSGTGSFRRCLAIDSLGTGRQQEIRSDLTIPDLGHSGNGFFFRGNNTDIEDSIAVSCADSGYTWVNKGFGFGSSSPSSRDPLPSTALRHPEIANGAPTLEWQYAPTTRFNRCQSIACSFGARSGYWMIYGGPKSIPHDSRQEVMDFTGWNIGYVGFDFDYAPQITIRRAYLRADTEVSGFYGVPKPPTGIQHHINTHDNLYDNVRVEGFVTGWDVVQSVNGFTDLKHFMVDNCNFTANDVPIQTNGPSPITVIPPQSIVAGRLRFDTNALGAFPDGNAIEGGIAVTGIKWDSIGSTQMTADDQNIPRFIFKRTGLEAIISKGYYADINGTYIMLPCIIFDRLTCESKVVNVRQSFNPSANPGLLVGPPLGTFNEQGKVDLSINCGGTASGGYGADQFFTSGAVLSVSRPVFLADAKNAGPEVLYQSARKGQVFSYALTGFTPNAFYTLRLHFAEIEESIIGRRIFDVIVNQITVLSGLDVLAVAGARDVALTRAVTVKADGTGTLTITLRGGQSTNQEAILNGFEIVRGLIPIGVPATIFNAPAGAFATAQTISLFNQLPQATLYYTTDGSTPTTSSRQYTTPFTISTTSLLRVLSTAGTLTPREDRGYYTIQAGAPSWIVNGGFEYPQMPDSLSDMAFGTNTVLGNQNGFPYGWTSNRAWWDKWEAAFVRGNSGGAPAPTDGFQLARLTDGSTISQTVRPPAGQYVIRAYAARSGTAASLSIAINGVLMSTSVLGSSPLAAYQSAPFAVSSGQSVDVELGAMGGTIFLDQIRMSPATPGVWVALVSPSQGSVSGAQSTMVLTADARSNTGSVTRVEFYDGSVLLGQSTAPSMSFNWTGATVGNHSLVARAFDSAGQSADSVAVSFKVLPPLPTVQVTAPSQGVSIAAGTASLTATATGSVTSVAFIVDGTLLGSDTTAPYQLSWSASAGVRQIQAVCYDSAGQQAVSSTVSVLVVDGANTAPTISNITDQTITQSTTTTGIAFSVNDAQSNPGSLTVSASSSNATLVPVANIIFGGSGSSRTLTMTPVFGLTGSSIITVTVSDGALSANDAFTLQVQSASVSVPDTTPPTTPAAPTVSGNGGPTPTLNGITEPGATITVREGSTMVATVVASGTGTWTVTIPGLTPGSHTLTVVATDASGNSSSNSPSVTVLVAVVTPGTGIGTGLSASYFNNMTLTAPTVLTRTDANLNFTWAGSPGTGVNADGFSVRWTGQVQAPLTGTYTFFTTSDDGIRLWVNGTQLINNWTDHGPVEDSGSIALVAGSSYDIRVEFYENGGGATAVLSWSCAGLAKQVVPQDRLYVPSAPINTAPAITTQPGNMSVTVGQTATFSVVASGTSPSYQWKRNGTAISGATAASYTTPATVIGDTGATFAVVVSNSAGSATSNAATLTVTAVSTPPGTGTGTGLSAIYFNNMTLTAPSVLARTDATVNFNWSGSPGTGINADGFSARWTGKVQAPLTGTYTFFTTSDDGIRLWVNGTQLINNWTVHGPVEDSGSIALVAGSSYDIRVEFYESGGGATAVLSWSCAGLAKQVVPQDRLYIAAPPTVGFPLNSLTIGTSTLGSYSDNGSSITVAGSGSDIWNSADGFQFASQSLTGDGTIVVRVASLQNTNVWAKAGVMVREGTGSGAKFAFCCVTSANGVAFQRRTATNSAASHTAGSASSAPRWLKLTRVGSVLKGYESSDGQTWTLVGSVTISMTNPVQIGLAVTSHNDGVLCTAVFDHLLITPSGNG